MGELTHRRLCVAAAIFVLLSIIVFCGCRGRDSGVLSRLIGDEDRTGGAVVLTLESPLPAIDPLTDRSPNARSLYYFVFDNLVDYDENLHIVPRLAKSWEWSNAGKSIIFHLRDDVRWHNDAVFNAADVISTWQRYRNLPSEGRPARTIFSDVENVSSITPYTVRVDYSKPRAAALTDWVVEILPSPEKLSGPSSPGASTGSAFPVGSGPFRVIKIDAKEPFIELKAFDGYFNGRPYLDTVFVKTASSRQVMADFLEKKTDFFRVPDTDLNRENIARLKESGEIHDIHGVSFVSIGWKSDGTNAFFKHRRIRKAIALAIDREKLLNKLFVGHGAVCDVPLPISLVGDNVQSLPFSPRLAVDLLREVGCKDNTGNGVRELNGQDFRFSLMYSANDVVLRATAHFIQDSLRKIGITMIPLELPPPEYVRRLTVGEFDAFLQETDIPMDLRHLSLYASSTEPRIDNILGFRDARLTEAIDSLATTIDHDARMRKLTTIKERIVQEQPCAFLYYRPRLSVIRRDIQEVTSSPRGIWQWYPSFLEWYLPVSDPDRRPQ